MKRLLSEITIGDFRFNYVTNLSIESSWDTFTDTARIIIPNKFRKDNKTIIVGDDNTFKRGDVVEIKLGYFSNLITKFKGFLTKIKPESPLIFDCEDRMWLLKQENVASKSFRSATIKDVVDFVAPDETIEYDDPTAQIGGFEIDNKNFINAVKIFEVLKKQFGYHIYFKDEKLQVRALNSIISLTEPIHKMSFQNNIIEDNLEYIREDDLKIVIKAESIKENNTRIIVFGFKEKGEVITTLTPKEGELRSLKFYNFTQKQLEDTIKRSIDNIIYEGYAGDFTTFLESSVEHSDRIELTDLKHAEREGRYLIKKVVTGFGINGGRQTIDIQNRIL